MNKKKSDIRKESLTNKIMRIFLSSPQKKMNYKQVSSILNIKDSIGRKNVLSVLEDLTEMGSIKSVDMGKYQLKSKLGIITGRVDMTKHGYAFIISDDISEDIFVSLKNLNTALDGDIVKVAVYAKKKSSRMEGEVVNIIKRHKTEFVGTIEKIKNTAFLLPDHHKMIFDIFIPLEDLNGAKHGQKVIAEITEWYHNSKNPTGKVIEILGNPGENEVEMHSILAEFGLPIKFSEESLKHAEKIKENFSDYDYKTRRDFRKVTTFTIDPEDAKDFDDALSFQKIDEENFEIGVHIADVTHYLDEGSELDKEAYERATSVYLVDRVVPMLPERLSNYLCSLRPNEEKLCFSAVFKMDMEGTINDVWLGKTIIKSDRRFNYQEVQEIIDSEHGDYLFEILTINKIAQNLRKARFQKGSFNFDHNEIKFNLNEKLEPISVYFKTIGEANHLVEEFMLLANKKVAEFVGQNLQKEFVYRIHDKPNPEKLNVFTGIINKFGYTIKTDNNKNLSQSMNSLVTEIHGKPEQNLIESLAIRAMSKAVYSTKNIGHYGLAFKFYSHFTSPIRRYPDVLVHRLLYKYLKKQKPPIEELEAKCKHCSFKEQQAVNAERASVKYKQAEYLADKIGEVYKGIITGVTDWGFFVEIKENACEGLVHMRTLTDDFYEYDAENFMIKGRDFGVSYQLGDEVVVEITKVDIPKKQIDFNLA